MSTAELIGPKLYPTRSLIYAEQPPAVKELFVGTSHYVTVTAQYSPQEGAVQIRADRGAAQELVKGLLDKNGQRRDQTLSVADWRRFVARCIDRTGLYGYNNATFGRITPGEMALLKLVERKAKNRDFTVTIAGINIKIGAKARELILVDVPSIRGKHAAQARWG